MRRRWTVSPSWSLREAQTLIIVLVQCMKTLHGLATQNARVRGSVSAPAGLCRGRCLNREEIFEETADQVQEGLPTSQVWACERRNQTRHAKIHSISLNLVILLAQWV